MIKKILQSKLFRTGFTIIGVWILIVTTIQAFKKPELTETERFLLIPKNAVLQFETTDNDY